MISLLTDKHAFYLLAAFGISTVALVFNIWFPLKQRHQLIQRLKQGLNESAS
jgi:heme exporter protein CcmD